MVIFSSETEFHIEERTVVTLGKFDGIHMGHMALINAAGKIAREKGYKLAVFTFDILPAVAAGRFEPSQITTNEEKREMFRDAYVDYLIEYPFNETTASMEPLDFIREVIADKLNAAYIVVGKDWHFGKDRSGNCDTLLAAKKLYNYEVELIDKEQFNQKDISSTWIRSEILSGNMENVNILLGYPYTIMGKVEYGKQLGIEMGFPTINIYPDEEKLLPPNGVYASKVKFEDKSEHYGITNIGMRPTFDDMEKLSVETHIFDFEGDIYGKFVKVELFHFQRPEMKFDTPEKLMVQVRTDMSFTRTFFMI